MADEMKISTEPKERITGELVSLDAVQEIEVQPDSPVIEGEVIETEPQRLPFYRKRIPVLLGTVILCLLLTASVGGTIFVLPLLFPSATITITPDAKTLSETFSVAPTGVMPLAAISLSLSQSVPTTGTGHQEASVASGDVTFYNAAPYAQTIPAGTLLTASSGVEAVTDAIAYIPAGNFATNGAQTVTAHTLSMGSSQNVPAYGFDSACCRDNVFVRNSEPFYGGMDARTYRAVAKRDVSVLVAEFTEKLLSQETVQFQNEAAPGEDTTTPLCSLLVRANHPVGSEAVSVTIAVQNTCTAWAFNKAALEDSITEHLSRDAVAAFGSRYTLASDPQIALQSASVKSSVLTFSASCAAMFVYQLSKDELQTLRAAIAGKSVSESIRILDTAPGIAQSEIHVGGSIMPRSATDIHMVVLSGK